MYVSEGEVVKSTTVPSRLSFVGSCSCARIEWLWQEPYGLDVNVKQLLTGPSLQGLLIPDLEGNSVTQLIVMRKYRTEAT